MSTKIFRLFDIALGLLVITAGLIIIFLWKFWINKQKNNASPTIVSLTRDTVELTVSTNNKSFNQKVYEHPGFSKTYVLHVGLAPNKVFNMGSNVIGVDIPVKILDHFNLRWPFLSRAILEIFSVFITIQFMRRVKSNCLELITPGPLEFRAIILHWLIDCSMMAQVRGNVDLISSAMGRYHYCRLPYRWLPLRWLASIVNHLISESFYKNCDLVIGYNRNNMENAISNGADPSKCRLLRIEVDLESFNQPIVPRSQLDKFPEKGKVAIIWSRLSQSKRLHEALAGFVLAAQKILDLELVIIGDGPEMKSLMSHALKSTVGERIHFLGNKNRSYIASAARHSDVAIVPYGGSSLVEAAILQVPIVAFDIEWHSELIRPGETGYLADYPDVLHLSNCLEHALISRDTTLEMSRNCYSVAQNMFDEESNRVNKKKHLNILLRAFNN